MFATKRHTSIIIGKCGQTTQHVVVGKNPVQLPGVNVDCEKKFFFINLLELCYGAVRLANAIICQIEDNRIDTTCTSFFDSTRVSHLHVGIQNSEKRSVCEIHGRCIRQIIQPKKDGIIRNGCAKRQTTQTIHHGNAKAVNTDRKQIQALERDTDLFKDHVPAHFATVLTTIATI